MKYLFTPAAERVLNHASHWVDPAAGEIDARALLLGLLAETDCRAAHLLANYGVAMQVVCDKWGISSQVSFPAVNSTTAVYPVDRDLTHAVREVYHFALEFERAPTLATEHLLLALLYSENETTRWLVEHGADATNLEADIRTRTGYESAPLNVEEDSEEGRGEWGEGREEENVFLKFEEKPEKEALQEQEAGFLPVPCPLSAVPSFLSPLPSPLSPLLRILDAAANRAREGLRVIEDFLRFVLDDRFLTETAKQLRHDLVSVVKKIPQADRLACRETQADVGTGLTTAGEANRADLSNVLAANFGRLQESLRSLEEYGKLIDPAMAAQFKQIRYRIYTLERAVEITRQSADRLAAAKLYVLIDGRRSLDEFREFASVLISSGVHILQLRDKNLDDRQLLARARVLRELTRQTPTLFIMNDRPDLAALSDADGVHLGQEELSVKDARTILGPQAIIGVSTHTIEQARQAVLDGANYIGVGPTFPSTTKDFAEFPGLDLLRQVAAEIRLPAFAIGGITLENLPDVLATGIGRVAVSGAIAKVVNPSTVTKDLLERLT